MARNLSGISPVAIPAPGLGPDQNVVRFDKSIEVLGSFRLGLVGLRGRDQFVAGLPLVDMDELVPKAGCELPFDLACGPQYFTGDIDVAALRHPAAHASDDARVGFVDGPGQ
jgi:hypothetical protein